MSASRWVAVLLVILLVAGLMSFARGANHRRGDEVGALSRITSVDLAATPITPQATAKT